MAVVAPTLVTVLQRRRARRLSEVFGAFEDEEFIVAEMSRLRRHNRAAGRSETAGIADALNRRFRDREGQRWTDETVAAVFAARKSMIERERPPSARRRGALGDRGVRA